MSNVDDRRDYGTFIPSFLDDFHLDMASFRLYAHIARRAGSGICWESVTTMAKVCQMDRKTAFKAFSFLQDRQMILVEKRAGQTSLITLTNHSVWLPVPNKVQVEPVPNKVRPRPKSGTPPVPNQVLPPVPYLGHPPVPYLGHKGNPYEGTPNEGTKEMLLSQTSCDRIKKQQQADQDKWQPQEIDCKALSKLPKFVEYVQTLYLPTVPDNRGKEIEITQAIGWIVKGQRDPARRDLVEIHFCAYEIWLEKQKVFSPPNFKSDRPKVKKPNPLTWTAEQNNWTESQWEDFLS